MFVTIIFALMLIAAAALCALTLINGIRLIIKRFRHSGGIEAGRVKRNMIYFLAACALCAGFVLLTQAFASTPGINGENAIAELRRVELNGRREWISIRGQDRSKPVLLFLAGGPGGTQMAAVRHDLAELERHFVVVNWDQPGSGKSYGAGRGPLAPGDYVDDGYALTRYLCEEFAQEKIYLVGESWGSALGIFMADRAPELYHAFIGTGQMVAFLETELMDYELAMQIARERGDESTLRALEANGPPPYYGADVTWKSAAYLQYLDGYMNANPEIHNGGYNTFRDLFSSEYGVWDKINFMRGIVTTFNTVYPQLYDIDLRTDYPSVGVPVYFFIGRHDVNAPVSLTEEYYELLDAPEKELVWFEHSGHSPWINESALFVGELLRAAGMK